MKPSSSGMLTMFGLFLCGCGGPQSSNPGDHDRDKPERIPRGVFFVDVTERAGLDFVHRNGGQGRKYLPEIMGAGACALDFDSDGLIDLYIVQSGQLPGAGGKAEGNGRNRLYRNRGDGTFEDRSSVAGLDHSGYGMGAASADYDNDGDADLFVVNFGSDVLFRNNGDGTFSDVTEEVGIEGSEWGSSAVFFDPDRDGDLDLFVVNYLEFSLESHVDCGTPSEGILSYCHPDVYPAAADAFWRNDGGFFRRAEREAGLTGINGKGLGAVTGDFNRDGWPDLYVANDSTPNFLYINRGDGTFDESALLWGAGYNEDGKTEAGMGVDAGDLDGDGRLDLFVTNLSLETNALYLAGDEEFHYHTRTSGLYEPSYLPVGFGTDLLDVDNDGDLDILVTNGHVIDNIELINDGQSFRQPGQLFLNQGKAVFSEVPAARLGDLSELRVGRSTVTLDFDQDGRLDVLVTFNNDRARLFRNEFESQGHWIGFLLRSKGNRDAVGTRVEVSAGGRVQADERKAGSSYQSSGDPRLHFGLGKAARVDQVRILWLDGEEQVFRNLTAGKYYEIIQGAASPLSSR